MNTTNSDGTRITPTYDKARVVKGAYREQWMQQCWLSAVQITLRILYHVELIQGRICLQGDVQQLSCAAIILKLGD